MFRRRLAALLAAACTTVPLAPHPAQAQECCEFWIVECTVNLVLYGDMMCEGDYTGTHNGAPVVFGHFTADFDSHTLDCTTRTFSGTGSLLLDGQFEDSFAVTFVGPDGIVTTGRGGAGEMTARPESPSLNCEGVYKVAGTVAIPL